MNPRRAPRRTTSVAAGMLLTAGLLAGCAAEAPPSGNTDVPTTLAPKPKVKKQKKPVIEAAPPRMLLNGSSSASADLVWQQSLDLVSDWLLNPKYMQRHPVTSVKELDGLAELMTPEAGARWRKQAHRALKGYVRPYPEWWQEKLELELPIHQLVTFSLMLRADRGWDNPMMTPVKIDDAILMSGNGGFGVIMPISTKFRLIGQGKHYRISTQSVLGLAWVPTDDGWKISEWWRVYRMDREKVKDWRPGQAPPVDPEGTPPAELKELDGGPSVDPTLYPE